MIYYNEIINKARPYGKDIKTSGELMGKLNNQPGDLWQNLQTSFMKLQTYVWNFEERDNEYIIKTKAEWNPVKIAEWLFAQLQPGMNHGYWMGSLERETRVKVLAQIAQQTQAVISANKSLGNRVHYVVGNWDMGETLEILRTGKKGPVGASDSDLIEESFNTIGYLLEKKMHVYDKIVAVETPATLTIVAPFPALRNRKVKHYPDPFDMDSESVQGVIAKAEEVRKKGKLIVIYAHAALEHAQARYGDNGDVARNFIKLLLATEADIVVYPHEHQMRKGPDGKVIRVNNHTVYEYFDDIAAVNANDRGWSIVTENNKLGKGQQVVTVYLPHLTMIEDKANPRTAVGVYRVFHKFNEHGRRNKPIKGHNSLPPKVL